ncbi:MAG: hypothetical protein WDM89_11430 [Rhizomicrobium sp.]
MTGKIPVGETIARAYGFAFGNILNNLGVIWIPVAILYGLVFLFYPSYMGLMAALISRDFEAVRQALPYLILGYVLLFVLLIAQVAALTKEALGLRAGSAWLQFPFGAAMWRLLIGYIALMLVCILLYIAMILIAVVGGIVGGLVASLASGASSKLIVGAVTVIFALGVFCALIYCVVRLSFLLAPAAVEGPKALRRGWALTRGNFWRIFVLILSVLLPLIVIECLYLYFVVGPDLLVPPHMSGMTQQGLEQWNAQRSAGMLALMQRMHDYWYIVYPIGLLFSLIMYGLFAGLSAFAYRALVPPDHPVPEAP